MHDSRELAEARVNRFLRERLPGSLWRNRTPADVSVWEAPGEPVPFARAVSRDFLPFSAGQPWGAPWGTTWFRVSGMVPEFNEGSGYRPELLIDLGFDGQGPGFQAEALVYAPSGDIVKAVEPRNLHVPLRQGPGEDRKSVV